MTQTNLVPFPSRRRHLRQPSSAGIATLAWREFLSAFDWSQGEHVTIIGPTGTGKTTLALGLLPLRSYTLAFASKRQDDTMAKLVQAGHRRMTDQFSPDTHDNVVLWPKLESRKDLARQSRVFEDAIYTALRSGGWCVLWDEAAYLSDDLKLTRPMRTLWQQGRSLGVSIVACTQRPAFIPVTAYDSATHLFFFSDNDERNLARIGGLGGMAAAPIREAVATLPKHSVLYLNTRTGEKYQTKVEA